MSSCVGSKVGSNVCDQQTEVSGRSRCFCRGLKMAAMLPLRTALNVELVREGRTPEAPEARVVSHTSDS